MHNKTKQSLISLELLSNIVSYDEINKKVKLPNSTLLQTGQLSHKMGPKPLGYILCFVEVVPLVRSFKDFYYIWM